MIRGLVRDVRLTAFLVRAMAHNWLAWKLVEVHSSIQLARACREYIRRRKDKSNGNEA